MKFTGIIPARYNSSRLPGKPLLDIKGKTMVQHVYERACNALENVYIATDSDIIFKESKKFTNNIIMTSGNHKSGTERCAEAVKKINDNSDIVINIQGDEPFIDIKQIELIKSCFDKNTEIASLAKKIDNNEDLFNPNKPKLVLNKFNEAIYFSRSPIPYNRNADKKYWHKNTYYKHIGMYAFKKDILLKIVKLKESVLEKTESLEQLRWIENGYKIKIAITKTDSLSIDTREDYNKAINADIV